MSNPTGKVCSLSVLLLPWGIHTSFFTKFLQHYARFEAQMFDLRNGNRSLPTIQYFLKRNEKFALVITEAACGIFYSFATWYTYHLPVTKTYSKDLTLFICELSANHSMNPA